MEHHLHRQGSSTITVRRNWAICYFSVSVTMKNTKYLDSNPYASSPSAAANTLTRTNASKPCLGKYETLFTFPTKEKEDFNDNGKLRLALFCRKSNLVMFWLLFQAVSKVEIIVSIKTLLKIPFKNNSIYIQFHILPPATPVQEPPVILTRLPSEHSFTTILRCKLTDQFGPLTEALLQIESFQHLLITTSFSCSLSATL